MSSLPRYRLFCRGNVFPWDLKDAQALAKKRLGGWGWGTLAQESMPKGTTCKKALHTFKGLYQIANQILFLGKFECRLCREKEDFKEQWCKREAERNTVTRSFAGFRKRSNSRWLLLKEQCDQVTRDLLIGPQASLPNTRCAALFWGTYEVSLCICYKSLQELFPCRRQTHLGNDWAMKISIVELESGDGWM